MATNSSDIAAWMSKANDPLMQDDVAFDPECPGQRFVLSLALLLTEEMCVYRFINQRNGPGPIPLNAMPR